MRTLLLSLPLLLAVAGCPKKVETTVTGSDDSRMDQYAAELEELRTSAATTEFAGPDICPQSERVCAVSGEMCGIAGRNSDRDDFQQRCGQSQETCAQFRDACARNR